MAEPEPPKERASSALLPRWTPSVPTNLINILNPFTTEPPSKTDDANAPNAAGKRSSILSNFFPLPTPTTPSGPSSNDDDSVMFAEPDTRSNSEGGSREGSVDESGRRRTKKCNKAKTCFSICHAPPTSTTRHKLHRRPRALLQMHRLSPDSRPRPAFEVIPSANFSVKLTRAMAKVFPAKHGRCMNDLVVLKAEKYSADEPDEDQEARDIIALICKGRKEDGQTCSRAKILFADGREWEAYPTQTGGYELFTTDEHGLDLTVRWVPKRSKDGTKTGSETRKRKFNFSTISPNSRRHPVIASMDQTRLDISDAFKIPNALAATPLSTPKQGPTILSDAMEEESEDTDLCETDDRLREIIIVSSIWVAFKEGWSPTFKYDDKDRDGVSMSRSPSLRISPSKDGRSSISLPPASPSSPGPASPMLEKRHSIASTTPIGLFRKGSLRGRGNRDSVPEEVLQSPPSPSLQSTTRAGRARADSTSTVLVHRAASNRARNSGILRQEALASQPESGEPSVNDSFSRSQSDGALPTASVPLQRSESPVRSGYPRAPRSEHSESEAGGATASSSRSRPHLVGENGKRETSATSERTTSTSEGLKKPPVHTKKKKKKTALLRLLCGGGNHT